MATTQEINELKRAELDALAVEQGLDPAQYSKAEDLRAELLKSADDADESAGDGEGQGEDNLNPAAPADEQNTTTKSPDTVTNDADRAAAAAETPTVTKPQGVSSHPASFDKYGQPIFGTGDVKKGRRA